MNMTLPHVQSHVFILYQLLHNNNIIYIPYGCFIIIMYNNNVHIIYHLFCNYSIAFYTITDGHLVIMVTFLCIIIISTYRCDKNINDISKHDRGEFTLLITIDHENP